MPNGTYGGVRGRKTKVGGKPLRFPPTRLEIMWQYRNNEPMWQYANIEKSELSV